MRFFFSLLSHFLPFCWESTWKMKQSKVDNPILSHCLEVIFRQGQGVSGLGLFVWEASELRKQGCHQGCHSTPDYLKCLKLETDLQTADRPNTDCGFLHPLGTGHLTLVIMHAASWSSYPGCGRRTLFRIIILSVYPRLFLDVGSGPGEHRS